MGFSELLTNWYNCINAFYCHFWDKKTSINWISNILISSNSNISILSAINLRTNGQGWNAVDFDA